MRTRTTRLVQRVCVFGQRTNAARIVSICGATLAIATACYSATAARAEPVATQASPAPANAEETAPASAQTGATIPETKAGEANRAQQAAVLARGFGLDDVAVITTENFGTLEAVLKDFNAKGKGMIIIDDRVPLTPLPVKLSESVRVVDLRSNNAVNIIRGHHPRQVGMWPQYSGLTTGLGKNIVLTDVVTPRTPIETWEGAVVPPQSTKFDRAQDYANFHNHYQNLLIETWNFTNNVNAVSFWADSAALTPGAKSWGGFISARSWPFRWGEYLPEGAPDFKDEDFDAALVGLEIDVLNFGKKHGEMSATVGQKLSKIGLQLVGFGQQSTAAVEIRSVDTDAFELHADKRAGTWYYGIIANNCFSSESTFIKAAFELARIGLDFSITDFTQGAIKIRSVREGSGFLINEGSSGEFFGGPRVRDDKDQRNWLNVRGGDGGTRFVSRDTKEEFLVIDDKGNVSIPGSLTIGGKKVNPAKLAMLMNAMPEGGIPGIGDGGGGGETRASTMWVVVGVLCVVVLALVAGLIWTVRMLSNMQRELREARFDRHATLGRIDMARAHELARTQDLAA